MLTLLALNAPLLLPYAPIGDASTLHHQAPEETLVWFETSELEPLLREGLEHPLVAAALKNPLVQAGLEESGTDLPGQLKALEALLGRPPLELAHALASSGIAFGLTDATPGSESAFLLLQGDDTDEMEEAVEELVGTLQGLSILKVPSAAQRRGLPASTTAFTVRGSDACLAWDSDGTLIAATHWATLQRCVTNARSSKALQRARRANSDLGGTFGWLDLDALEAQTDLEELRNMARDPGAQLVLGPVLTHLGRASELTLQLNLGREIVQLRAVGHGVDLGPGAALLPRRGARRSERHSWQLAGGLDAGAQLHRDLGTFFLKRTELFPPRAQPDLAEAMSNLSLLVGGPDSLNELIQALEPTLLLAAAPVEFPEAAKPDVPLPGISASIRLQSPEVNGARLTSAFQSAVAFVNVEQAMQGKPGLQLALQGIDGVTITTTKRPAPPKDASVDLSYNFAPACALQGEVFHLGTRPEAVIAALTAQPDESATADARGTNHDVQRGAPSAAIPVDRLSIRGSSVLRLLLQQRDLIVMQGVLEDGLTEERSRARTDTLLELLSHVVRIDHSSDWTPGSGPPERNRAAGASLSMDLTLHLAR